MHSRLCKINLALALLAVASACGGGEDRVVITADDAYTPLAVPVDFPGPTAPAEECSVYFDASPYDDPACTTPFASLGRQREMLLFSGAGSFDRTRFTHGLQRYLRLIGLTLFTQHTIRYVALGWILDDDQDALRRHLEKEFPDVDFGSMLYFGTQDEYDAIMREAAIFVMRPVIDFANVYGDLGPSVTHMVLLPALTRLESEGSAQGVTPSGSVVGLGLSPIIVELFRAQDTPEAEIWRRVPLNDFTPMLFVDSGLLDRLVAEKKVDPVMIDLAEAHEMGHTLGLEHLDVEHNLMNPSFEKPSDATCRTTLTAAQLDRVRQTLDESPPASASSALTVEGQYDAARQRGWTALTDHLAGRRPLRLFR
jgi:hypothetical protein